MKNALTLGLLLITANLFASPKGAECYFTYAKASQEAQAAINEGVSAPYSQYLTSKISKSLELITEAIALTKTDTGFYLSHIESANYEKKYAQILADKRDYLLSKIVDEMRFDEPLASLSYSEAKKYLAQQIVSLLGANELCKGKFHSINDIKKKILATK